MGVWHRETCLRGVRIKREREAAAQSAALVMFRQAAEAGQLDNATIAAHAVLFDDWDGCDRERLTEGSIVREGKTLFRLSEPLGTKAKGKLKPPSKSPDLWEMVGEVASLA